jgi:acetyl-CoA acetyltransferase family protein
MGDALVVGAVRSPVGRRGGALAGRHPADLLGEVLAALADRAGIDPALIDDVIVGCVDQVGEQGVNVGRSAVLAAGFPDTVPATTIDRQCGSSQQAAHFAAQGVMAGAYDLVVAAGVESMTRVPMWSNVPDRAAAYGTRMRARYGLAEDGLIEQGESGEIVADRWGLTREELDAFALRSHRRAAAARDAPSADTCSRCAAHRPGRCHAHR